LLPDERRRNILGMGVLYTLFIGFPLCVLLMAVGLFLTLTIIGAPIGFACFALAFKVLTLPPRRRVIVLR
jgi:uncharacterized membrane protein YccF (DUF307 family)